MSIVERRTQPETTGRRNDRYGFNFYTICASSASSSTASRSKWYHMSFKIGYNDPKGEEGTMIAAAAIANILGIQDDVRTVADLDGAVSRGLSKQAVVRVVSRIALNEKSARALRDQVVPSATWKRTKGRLSVHVSERAERLARVMAAAEYTWDDADQARVWMNEPHSELGGRTPLATATTELGARSVETVLDKLFYGLPA
jgi:putative toxin-antitoxin system antitoxin component (TIGR02293 family)